MNNLLNNKWITVIITKLQVAPVELDVSSQSSSSCRASGSTRVARRVERVELCCSTSSTQPKCMGSTRRMCRVESSRAKWNLSFTALLPKRPARYLLDGFDVGAITRVIAATADQTPTTCAKAHQQQRNCNMPHFWSFLITTFTVVYSNSKKTKIGRGTSHDNHRLTIIGKVVPASDCMRTWAILTMIYRAQLQ